MMSIFFQVVCTVIVCFQSIITGVIIVWPSSTVKLFESRNTTLNRPMSNMELSLFGGMPCLGSLLGTALAGYYLDRIGRKKCCIIVMLLSMLSWILKAISNRVEVIIFAAFISGFSGTTFLTVPVFVSEFCQESIRGALTSCMMSFFSGGILVSYVLGEWLDYYGMIHACLGMNVAAVLLLLILKESPLYLMKKRLFEDAAVSIAFYRRKEATSKLVMSEIEKYRRALNYNDDALTNLSVDTTEGQKRAQNKSLWYHIRTSHVTRRALTLNVILLVLCVFQGLMCVKVYAKPLFEKTVPSLPSTVCCIILAVVIVLSSLTAGYLADIVGRRSLIIYASLCTGICCVLLGTQIQMEWGPLWLSALFIYLFSVSFNFGASIIPFMIATEIFLPEIKSMASMFVVEAGWVAQFVLLFVFRPIFINFGLYSVFYIFASICFLTMIFSAIFLPETKGLQVDAIHTLFMRSYNVPILRS